MFFLVCLTDTPLACFFVFFDCDQVQRRRAASHVCSIVATVHLGRAVGGTAGPGHQSIGGAFSPGEQVARSGTNDLAFEPAGDGFGQFGETVPSEPVARCLDLHF